MSIGYRYALLDLSGYSGYGFILDIVTDWSLFRTDTAYYRLEIYI